LNLSIAFGSNDRFGSNILHRRLLAIVRDDEVCRRQFIQFGLAAQPRLRSSASSAATAITKSAIAQNRQEMGFIGEGVL
jgi:hypothetical protein